MKLQDGKIISDRALKPSASLPKGGLVHEKVFESVWSSCAVGNLAAAAAADPAVLELSLEQAITQALDHNLDLHLIKIDLEEAQKN